MNNEYNTDLIGKQFGFLEVVKKDSEKTKQGKAKWICKCHACGKTKSIPRAALISGNARSCGCRVRAAKSKNVMDLTGKTFGFLEVLHKISGCGGETMWKCKCLRCGATKNILQRSLVNGDTKSCGCLHHELSSQNVKKYIGNIDKTTVSIIRSKKKYASNTSGVRGVSWSKNTQKWHAYIQFKGTLYNLGYYADINEAANVRKIAEEKMFGEFLEWYNEQKNSQKG